MQITRSSIETQKGPADWFTGDVYIDAIAAPAGTSTFAAAARSNSASGALRHVICNLEQRVVSLPQRGPLGSRRGRGARAHDDWRSG
jgi:hypothetical protein